MHGPDRLARNLEAESDGMLRLLQCGTVRCGRCGAVVKF